MKNNYALKIYFLFILMLSNFIGFAQQYTTILDSNFEKALIDLNIDSGPIDKRVLTANVANLTILDLTDKGCTDLTGLQDFTSLKRFICNNSNLSVIDLSKNTALTTLILVNNGLTSLDISKNTLLNYLDLTSNEFSALDLSNNVALETIQLHRNKFTSLDISKNILLKELYFTDNQLVNLDISKNTLLNRFSCYNNNLTSVNTSANTALISFSCNNNQITTLDISKNLGLQYLGCYNNKIVTLDVSKNSSLTALECNNNELQSLNLKNGKNTALTTVAFNNNSNLSCIQVDDQNYSNSNWSSYKDAATVYSNNCAKASTTAPPALKATGDQLYCPGSDIKIVETFFITHDPSETGTLAGYVQISSGYATGDRLNLSNAALHPSVTTSWDSNTGKITLTNVAGGEISYSDLEAAIKDIVYTNPSATATGTKTFSITIGQANYLPLTGHYYLFIPSTGITWNVAKTAAENLTYYGLKGYLATILSADEAKLIGEQASGTGWIGGSDAETEGVWKWVTGPEAGTVFWNGNSSGSTPNFAFWNTGEPNQQGDEDYAHITQPGVGIRGSWNDLSNTGSLTPGDAYQPKGYIVEYGGMPDEAPLEIAASTKITIPVATPSIDPTPVCDSGNFTFNATATGGATIRWFDAAFGGNLLATGPTYTTPTLTTTTNYYVDAGCESNRKSVKATVNVTPSNPIAEKSTYTNCGSGALTIKASSNIGSIDWFASATGGTTLFTGTTFTTPTISSNTTYYAEASNNGCINSTRTAINIEIYTPPAVTDETLSVCQFQTITLDAGISGMTYLWSNGATTQTTTVNAGGKYTVTVTSPSPENCPSTKTITVEERKVPQIARVDVEGTRAIIYPVKAEDYFEYSVDGVNFQDSTVFYDVPGGLQTAYAREKSGCGETTKQFVVLVFPAFFTPNNDNYNDIWEVTGMENYPQAVVTIFDRYGKLIAQLSRFKMSWDGTFDQVPLPASDYWYALKVDDSTPILRGHFTLKR